MTTADYLNECMGVHLILQCYSLSLIKFMGSHLNLHSVYVTKREIQMEFTFFGEKLKSNTTSSPSTSIEWFNKHWIILLFNTIYFIIFMRWGSDGRVWEKLLAFYIVRFFSPSKDVARNEEEYFYVFYLLFSHNKSISNNDI